MAVQAQAEVADVCLGPAAVTTNSCGTDTAIDPERHSVAALVSEVKCGSNKEMMVQWESFQQLDHLAEGAFFWTVDCKRVKDRLGQDVLDELTHKVCVYQCKKEQTPLWNEICTNLGLTDDQLLCLLLYTAERSHQTGESPHETKRRNVYSELNSDIRRLKTCSLEERHIILQAWGPLVSTLIQTLRRLPSYEGVVWRGVVEPLEEVQRLFPPGRIVQMAAFTSTSTDKRTASRIAGGGGTVFQVMSTGANAFGLAKISLIPNENEVLFLPNTFFYVGNARHEVLVEYEDPVAVIDLMEVANTQVISS